MGRKLVSGTKNHKEELGKTKWFDPLGKKRRGAMGDTEGFVKMGSEMG